MLPKRDTKVMVSESRAAMQQALGMIDTNFLHEIQQFVLEAMVRLTASQVGFFYTIDAVAGTIAVNNISVSGRAAGPQFHGRETDLDQPGFWSDCIASNELVIRPNSVPFTPPRRREIGSIKRDITVPIFDANQIVAVIGVANRAAPYELVDAETLQQMATDLGRILVRKKLHDTMSDDVK